MCASTRLRYRIEHLEARWLLASFSGTSGADQIEVVSHSTDNHVHVLINNVDHDTTDATITIDALGGDDVVQCFHLTSGSSQGHVITFDLGDGNDSFTASLFDGNSGSAIVNDGAGNDTLTVDDSLAADRRTYTIENAGIGIKGQNLRQYASIEYSSTFENFSLQGSGLGDTMQLDAKPPTMALSVSEAGSPDQNTFSIGGGDLDSNGWTQTTLIAGNGKDSIGFEDFSDTFSASETETVSFNTDELDKGPVTIHYHNFASQNFNASDTGDGTVANGEIVDLNTATIPTEIEGFSDQRFCTVNIGFTDLTPITATVDLYMPNGGAGNINDQNSSGDKTYTFNGVLFTASSGQTIDRFSSGPALTLNANGGNNMIALDKWESSDPLVINGGGGNDTVTVGDGNLDDVVCAVHVSGGNGTDSLTFDDSADPTGQTETLTDTSLTTGANTFGFDTIESLRLAAGLGADTINQQTDNAAGSISIGGGGGNDTFNMDLSSYIGITVAPAVSLSGDAGNDLVTFNDSVGTNFATISSLTYLRGATPIFNYAAFESLVYNAGPASTSILVPSTAAGTPVTINAGGGADGITIGGLSGTLNNLAAPITVNGEDGSDLITFADTANTSAQTFHVYPTSVTRSGMSTVTFGTLESITLNEGAGADTTYVVPNATASIRVNGNNPTTSPGDTLGLAFATAQNPVFSAGGTGAGGYTFTNRAAVNYSGIETNQIDSVAPTIANASFVYDAPVQSVQIAFSEDVTSVPVSALSLTNLTSGHLFTTAELALNYLAAASTAIITFPTQFHGILPDGNYHALVSNTLTDSFGNALAGNTAFDFFFLTADANHDRTVNAPDFVAMAMNFNKTSGVTFSGGDFNYDGRVNALDFNILATNFGRALPVPAPGSVAAAAAGTPATASARLEAAQPTGTLFPTRLMRRDDNLLQILPVTTTGVL
jgi:dockerin type I repeat protein